MCVFGRVKKTDGTERFGANVGDLRVSTNPSISIKANTQYSLAISEIPNSRLYYDIITYNFIIFIMLYEHCISLYYSNLYHFTLLYNMNLCSRLTPIHWSTSKNLPGGALVSAYENSSQWQRALYLLAELPTLRVQPDVAGAKMVYPPPPKKKKKWGDLKGHLIDI